MDSDILFFVFKARNRNRLGGLFARKNAVLLFSTFSKATKLEFCATFTVFGLSLDVA